MSDINKLIDINDILSLIKSEKDNYSLLQTIRYRDEMYEYKFSLNGENISKDFITTLDKDTLKQQLKLIATMEKMHSMEKIETITKNFNLDDLEEKICRT